MNKWIIVFLIAFLSPLKVCSQLSFIIDSAEKGDVSSQMYLAEIYRDGKDGVSKNLQESFRWYFQAANQGNKEAQYNVGWSYLYGQGVSKDKQKAIDWFKKSADNGYPPGLTKYAQYVLIPQQRCDEAIKALEQAILGFDPMAAYLLGLCYFEGKCVSRDLNKAEKLFDMAKLAKIPNSFLYLGYCAAEKRDYLKAADYYKQAFEHGLIYGYNELAHLYATGKGVKKDLKEAHRLIDIAISEDPYNANYYDSKGEFYLMEDNMIGAKDMWNKVLQFYPDAASLNSPLAIAMSNNIDNNIPISTTLENKTFAVIFANEDYKRVASVPYAKNDGKVFAEYSKKTLGIPVKNVYYVENATLGDMKYHINLLKKIAQAFNGEAKIILYYAGHGIPDETQKDGYLLPIDGYGNDATSGYPLKNLYSELAGIPSKSILVFLDACFSGSQRDGNMLDAARGVAIKPKNEVPMGNVVVFSAASGDETAYPYKEKNHGLFTYFLLKKMQESKGDVSLGELEDYVATNVEQTSITNNKKSQTPTVTPSPSMGNTWKSIKLK